MRDEMTTWLDALVNATQNAVNKVIWFTPNLIMALLVLFVGTVLGRWLGTFVESVLNKMKASELTASLNMNKYLEPFGLKSPQQLLGKLVHLFIVLVAVIAAADILHLPQVTALIQTVLMYIPKAIVALLILGVGLWAARFVESLLKGDLVQRVPALKGLVRFLIVSFALLATLDQFNISARLIEILFGGLVFAMSLAIGLSFGLGGKDFAKSILEKLQKK